VYPIIVRTLVQLTVSLLLGQAAKYGFNIPSAELTAVVTVVIGTAYVALAHYIEQSWPGLGKWLTSLGMLKPYPSYAKPVGAKARYVGRM